MQEIIVPTIDTVRYTYLMDLCIRYGVLVFSVFLFDFYMCYILYTGFLEYFSFYFTLDLLGVQARGVGTAVATRAAEAWTPS